MPAVSGSPTQIKTSAATAADLAGTPDDQFETGDFACVLSLLPNGTFRLNRASVGPANGTTVIATFSGNGFWEVFPGAALTTASAAAFVNSAGAVPIDNGLTSRLQATITLPGPGVVDVSCAMEIDGGTDGASLLGNLRVTYGANPPSVLDGSTFGQPNLVSAPTGVSTPISTMGRTALAPAGTVVTIDLMIQDQALNADGSLVSAFLSLRFFPS